MQRFRHLRMGQTFGFLGTKAVDKSAGTGLAAEFLRACESPLQAQIGKSGGSGLSDKAAVGKFLLEKMRRGAVPASNGAVKTFVEKLTDFLGELEEEGGGGESDSDPRAAAGGKGKKRRPRRAIRVDANAATEAGLHKLLAENNPNNRSGRGQMQTFGYDNQRLMELWNAEFLQQHKCVVARTRRQTDIGACPSAPVMGAMLTVRSVPCDVPC